MKLDVARYNRLAEDSRLTVRTITNNMQICGSILAAIDFGLAKSHFPLDRCSTSRLQFLLASVGRRPRNLEDASEKHLAAVKELVAMRSLVPPERWYNRGDYNEAIGARKAADEAIAIAKARQVALNNDIAKSDNLKQKQVLGEFLAIIAVMQRAAERMVEATSLVIDAIDGRGT